MTKRVATFLFFFAFLPVFVFAQDGRSDLKETAVPDPGLGAVQAELGTGASRITSPGLAPVSTPTPDPTPTTTPPPKISQPPSSQRLAPTSSPSSIISASESNQANKDNFLDLIMIGLTTAGILGCLVMLFMRVNKKNSKLNKQNEGKCDSIRELLEQKKKELEDFVRKWPEEKLKEMAKEKIIDELKKNDDIGRVVETAESLKAKHDKIKKAVEMLQKRYDLCMLGLPSTDSFKAVIFDLNGVFVKSSRLSDRFYDKFGVPTNEFISALGEIMAKIRMPDADDAYEYWKPYLEKWRVNLSKQDFFDFWFNNERSVPEMIDLANKLKSRGLKLFILSNNFSERTGYYEKNFPFLKILFDKVYYSWQTGFVKPDPEAFKLILSENKLKPEECVYFDDSGENIKAAERLGIKSFVFKDADDVKNKLGLK